MTCVTDLPGLPLAAVGRAPEGPLRLVAEHVQALPELRADAGVRRILDHPPALAVANLPADLTAELEVQALVVDGPRAVRVHQDAVVGGGDHLLEAARAWKKTDVRHSHHRESVVAVTAHRASRFGEPGEGRGIAAREDADPGAVAHDVDRVGRR